jgi:hypothetical protein
MEIDNNKRKVFPTNYKLFLAFFEARFRNHFNDSFLCRRV